MPKTHLENMEKVCIVCFGASDRPLTKGLKDKFKEHLCPRFWELAPFLPTGICSTHRVALGDYGNRKQSLTADLPDYEQLAQEQRNLPPLTRSSGQCECRICLLARTSFNKRGLMPKKKPGRPATNAECPLPETITICTKCQSQVGKGLTHDCTRTTRRSNIQKSLTPRVKQQITSQTLKDLANPHENRTTAVLGTQGRSMNLSFEFGCQEASTSSHQISHDAMKKMQVSLNLSDRKTLQAAQVLRGQMGATAIEPNLREALQERNRLLGKFFSHQKLFMIEKSTSEAGGIQRVAKDAVICNDIQGLFKFVKEERQSTGDLMFKVGIDGGGGSLKVCWNAVQQPSPQSDAQTSERKKGFLDSGVKKLIILAIVPSVSE